MARLFATLRAINPGATSRRRCAARRCRCRLAPSDQRSSADGRRTGRPEPIRRRLLAIDEDIDWTAFSVWLSALIHARGEEILRVKGVVRTPAGRLLLQSVRKIVQSPEILPDPRAAPGDNTLVFIGRGLVADRPLERSLRRFVGARASALRAS